MPNLIYNGDFQLITQYQANNWTSTGIVDYIIGSGYSDQYACKISYAPYVQSSINQINIPTIISRNYTLSFYTKIIDNSVNISVNINGNITILSIISTSYSQSSINFTANTSTTSITFTLDSVNDVFIDNVLLTSANFVTNGNFENSLTNWTTSGNVVITSTPIDGLNAAQLNISSSLAQSNIATVLKQNYVLLFWARRATLSSTKFNLTLNDLTATLNSYPTYTFYAIVFNPSTATTTLTFATNNVNDIIVDNIWIDRNLVLNGGFENFVGSTITSWTTSNGAVRITSPVVFGTSAVSMPSTSSAITQTNIQTVTNGTYLLSFWARLVSSASQNITVTINGVVNNILLNITYTNYTITFIATGTTNIIFTNPGSIGEYIDNVSITEISLVDNCNFENLTTNPNAPPWIKNTNVTYLDNTAELSSQGSISQSIDTSIGTIYNLYLMTKINALPASILSLLINGIVTNYNINSTNYILIKKEFVATTTTTEIQLFNETSLSQPSIIYIDDVIVNAVSCYTKETLVLSKNILTDEIMEIPVSEIKSDTHLVFSTLTQSFIPVIYNIVTGPYHRFRLIKKDAIEKNKPKQDFYLTSGHVIVIDGKETKVKSCIYSRKITTKPQLVYTICTNERQPIVVNNMEVIAYGKDEWLNHSKQINIAWHDNQTNNI